MEPVIREVRTPNPPIHRRIRRVGDAPMLNWQICGVTTLRLLGNKENGRRKPLEHRYNHIRRQCVLHNHCWIQLILPDYRGIPPAGLYDSPIGATSD